MSCRARMNQSGSGDNQNSAIFLSCLFHRFRDPSDQQPLRLLRRDSAGHEFECLAWHFSLDRKNLDTAISNHDEIALLDAMNGNTLSPHRRQIDSDTAIHLDELDINPAVIHSYGGR